MVEHGASAQTHALPPRSPRRCHGHAGARSIGPPPRRPHDASGAQFDIGAHHPWDGCRLISAVDRSGSSPAEACAVRATRSPCGNTGSPMSGTSNIPRRAFGLRRGFPPPTNASSDAPADSIAPAPSVPSRRRLQCGAQPLGNSRTRMAYHDKSIARGGPHAKLKVRGPPLEAPNSSNRINRLKISNTAIRNVASSPRRSRENHAWSMHASPERHLPRQRADRRTHHGFQRLERERRAPFTGESLWPGVSTILIFVRPGSIAGILLRMWCRARARDRWNP